MAQVELKCRFVKIHYRSQRYSLVRAVLCGPVQVMKIPDKLGKLMMRKEKNVSGIFVFETSLFCKSDLNVLDSTCKLMSHITCQSMLTVRFFFKFSFNTILGR